MNLFSKKEKQKAIDDDLLKQAKDELDAHLASYDNTLLLDSAGAKQWSDALTAKAQVVTDLAMTQSEIEKNKKDSFWNGVKVVGEILLGCATIVGSVLCYATISRDQAIDEASGHLTSQAVSQGRRAMEAQAISGLFRLNKR